MSLIRDTYLRFQVLVHEVAKFGVVGLIGFVVQLGVQNALHSGAGVGAITSVIIAYIIATVVTFIGNRHWAFKHRKGKGLKHETIVFVLLNVVGIVIQVGIVDIAYYELGYKRRPLVQHRDGHRHRAGDAVPAVRLPQVRVQRPAGERRRRRRRSGRRARVRVGALARSERAVCSAG